MTAQVLNIEKCRCDKCGVLHTANKRELVLIKEMIIGLYRVSKWCRKNGKFAGIKKRDYKHLFNGDNMTMRFPDWNYFAPELAYRDGKGWYFNLQNIEKFFRKEIKVASKIIKQNGSKEVEKLEFIFVDEVHKVSDFLDNDKEFIVEYGGRQENSQRQLL